MPACNAARVLEERPRARPLWGLAVDSADGVHGILNQLAGGLRTAMALCGMLRLDLAINRKP